MYFRPPFYLREKFSLPKLKDNDDISYKKTAWIESAIQAVFFIDGIYLVC